MASLGLVSCGNENQTQTQNSTATTTTSEENSNIIDLKGTDDMKFDKTSFTVKVGQEVTLNFTNAGVLPIETMGHNVVVLEQDADVKAFAAASSKEKEKDYISDLYITDIIAHTKLLGPGESETLKFTLKEAGDYPFICTFPGHWIVMKGTIKAVN